ncbi:MAG TPA: glycosyltransferase family 4 protein [Flavipsychrobacter sp.]|nr:glycosyltransferase family 4 protein [Flavipsychrobacter sp.]
MAPRRILILTNRIPYPLNDGGNLAMHAMIEGYHKAGWQVYLLAMHTHRHAVSEADLKRLYPYIHAFDTVDVDNRVKPLGTIKNFLFSKEANHADRFFHLSFLKKIKDILQKFDPDAIQFESVFLATYLPYIKKQSKALAILRVHNIEYEVWERLANKTSHPLKRIYLKDLAKRIRNFEEKAWKQFDLLLPITGIDAHVIRQTGISKNIQVAPFALDIHKPHVAQQEEWNGYHIGAMDWIPNAESISWLLTEVWPRLHKVLPEFKFFFAGRNMPASFKKNLPEGVTCVGEVADADKFIADKKILIVPLRSGSGIRVKILEAMAVGKIVISTDIGIQGINAQPNVHYLPANTSDEFVNTIKWCLQNKSAAMQIAANAMEFVKTEYDPNFIMESVLKKVNNLLTNH